MRLKYFLLAFILCFPLFALAKVTKAQSTPVNGNSVGPEIPDPAAATNVVERNGFTGTVAVINDITEAPHNPAPNAHVVLRIQVHAKDFASSDITGFASALNNSSEFNHGGPTVVVLGVELNNLDPQGWDGARSGNDQADLIKAANQYAQMFNQFSAAIADHNKYIIAPAPPDLYQAPYQGHFYDPKPWVQVFASTVRCNLVDTLVADVFDVAPSSTISVSPPGGEAANLYTWQYLEQHICPQRNLKVTHFEGWGANPNVSIKDQIDFLRNHRFPTGSSVSTATTLIVNNCDGFGGNQTGSSAPNKPWLYWIPTTPDKVYNADGSEFDYINCKTGTIPTKPYPLTDVPCNDTVDPEFHSLRPYPASPCKKQVEETALFCANDLIVKTTFKVTPNDNCTGDPNDFFCTYTMTNQESNIGIDLKGAELPILGNTELVPNATWTSLNSGGTNLTAGQRMNEYVSWYLNGVIDRAEEDFSAFDPTNLINYSGPLKKLLPWAVQTITRIHSIDDAAVSVNATEARDFVRHNQIVGCLLPGTIAQAAGPFPCYLDTIENIVEIIKSQDPNIDTSTIILLKAALDTQKRLASWIQNKPPLESYYSNFTDYWKAYLQWKGKVCIDIPINILGKQLYFCLGVPSSFSFFANFFNHVPLSSTEDRKGQVVTDDNAINPNTGKSELAHTAQLKDGQGNGGEVTNVSFNPTSDNHSLYFAHTEEVAQLGQLLQNTYATKSDSNNDWENAIRQDVKIHNPDVEGGMSKFTTSGCNKVDVRANPPGDNLYGDIDRGGDQQISGTLKYDVTFKCEFKKQIDQQCINKCTPDDQSCIDACSQVNTCTKDIYTSLGIYTKTPKIQEIWDRLVNGEMAVFKRFFPMVGVNSVLTEIKDIPASTKVTYTSTTGEAKAGMTGRGGSEAQLFFPHVGSLQEYFLQGIQKALRPKDVAAVTEISGQQEDVTPKASCQINCNSLPDSAIPAVYLGTFKENYLRIAQDWVKNKDGTRSGKDHAQECYNDVVKRSLDAGVNPVFSLAIWAHESGASNYTSINTSCATQDFGINNPSIASNFDAQITRFLQLPNAYRSNYPECFTSKYTGMQNFFHIYRTGAEVNEEGICGPTKGDLNYDGVIHELWNWITVGTTKYCPYPTYPTEISCQ